MSKTLLSLRDLKKSFREPDGSENLILNMKSFEMNAGEAVSLAGESGSGKTTLLNLIGGIQRPDQGEIHFNGLLLSEMSQSKLDALRASSIAYVFQTFNLLQGFSALENVLLGMSFGGGADRQVAMTWLERLGLGDRMHHTPEQLSVGQQQRVALARALAKNPALVLADEPTGNLDPERARESVTLLRDTCEQLGAALLLVSHDPRILESFSRQESLMDLNQIPSPSGGEKTAKGASKS